LQSNNKKTNINRKITLKFWSWDPMDSIPDLGRNIFGHLDTKLSRKQCIFEKKKKRFK